ncbi:hypothetical protein J2Y03_004798 [Neobacillus niacini]|uniref:antiviral reverse transcriptase Drt3a n=1 Tax=Neobacillus niacini TaxID=86668 RepID=UPI00285A0848|nr:antiviral reverse transcriptase Drt3a [Neobacillus niacini]MDR7079740.1 hypothetical protein [Neobacillus niacini]
MKYQLTKDLLKNYFSTLYDQLKTGNDRVSKQKFNKIKEQEFNLILKKIDNSSYKFTSLKEITLPNKRKVYIPTIRDRLVLEYLKDRIKQKYRIVYPNRDDIIKSLLLKFDSKMDYYIIRLDIKQFFDSIPQNILLSKIKEKSLLSAHEYYILKELFKKVKSGIPQGLAISNVLSEIYMETFDHELKQIHNRVNYFCRYVDDIIIVINGTIPEKEVSLIKEKIEMICRGHYLQINRNIEKYKFTCFPIANIKVNEKYTFNYLGYEFLLENKKFSSTISKDKIEKFKQKIYFCFQEFKNNHNFELLLTRLDFLTKKNAVVKREQFITKNKKIKYRNKRICFGFIENYNLIKDEEKNKIAKDIDNIILSEINSIKYIINSKLLNLNIIDKKRLYSISLSRNMDNFNAIYRYKKTFYIDKLVSINPTYTHSALQQKGYKELTKLYFNYLK